MQDVLSKVDLNLFVVLRAVLDEGSATAAAKRLHVTQSAVSNALARLRTVFGDPLVVRKGRGLTATPRAQQLRVELDAALGQLAGLIAPQSFDARTTTRTFGIALTDNYELSDLPRLIERFRSAMPRAVLRVVSTERLITTDGLATGVVDVAIVPHVLEQPGMRKARLWDEPGVLLARRGHPELRGKITAEQFSRLPYVDVRVAGDDGIGPRMAKAHFAKLGITRNIAMIVPHFNAVAIAVAHSDCIGGLPERFGVAVSKLLPVQCIPSPFPTPPFSMSLAWHERTDHDAGSQAFRALVLETFGAARPAARPARKSTPRR